MLEIEWEITLRWVRGELQHNYCVISQCEILKSFEAEDFLIKGWNGLVVGCLGKSVIDGNQRNVQEANETSGPLDGFVFSIEKLSAFLTFSVFTFLEQ